MSSNSAAEMYHILVAHVLHDSIDVSELAEQQVVELELGLFLDKINQLAKEYIRTFQYPQENSDVDGDFVKKLVQFSEFSRFVSFDDDKLKVELTPQKFQALLTGILVDSSVRYSRMLAREVDDLTEKYVELRPPVPTIISLSELGGVPSANEDKPEITEKMKSEEKQAEAAAKNDEKSLEAADVEDEVTSEIESVDRRTEEELEKAQGAAAEAEDEAEDDMNEEEQETNEVEREEDKEHENAVKEETADDEDQGELMEVDTEEKELQKSNSPEDVDMDAEDVEDAKDAEADRKGENIEENANSDEGAQDKVEAKSQEPRADDLKVESPAAVAPSFKEEVLSEERPPKRSLSPLVSQKHKRFQNIAINLVKTIEEHRFLSPFLLPVVADQYEEVVFHPKDLKSILKAIKQKDEPAAYETVKELERDIMLMFANCVMYNKSSAHLVDMAKQMRDDVTFTFQMFEDAESEMA